MIGSVDAASRIAIDVPGAAHFGVLLDDRIGDTEPVRARRPAQWRRRRHRQSEPAARAKLLRRRRARRPTARRVRSRPISSRISGAYSGATLLAQRHVHHLPHQVIAGIGDDRLRIAIALAASVRRRGFRPGCFPAGLPWDPGSAARRGWRRIGRLEPAQVARHVNQNHQQHADIGFRDRVRRRSRVLRSNSTFMIRCPPWSASWIATLPDNVGGYPR